MIAAPLKESIAYARVKTKTFSNPRIILNQILTRTPLNLILPLHDYT